jgi:hypothetical protein
MEVQSFLWTRHPSLASPRWCNKGPRSYNTGQAGDSSMESTAHAVTSYWLFLFSCKVVIVLPLLRDRWSLSGDIPLLALSSLSRPTVSAPLFALSLGCTPGPGKHVGHCWVVQAWGTQHPSQHLLFFVFLVISLLTGVGWHLSAILIYISFMVKDVEYFSMYLLVICTSSFENCLFMHSSINWILCLLAV